MEGAAKSARRAGAWGPSNWKKALHASLAPHLGRLYARTSIKAGRADSKCIVPGPGAQKNPVTLTVFAAQFEEARGALSPDAEFWTELMMKKTMDWKVLVVIALILGVFFAVKRVSFVSAAKARELLQAGAMVVDVRNPGEFASGHIAGAVNIPLGELRSELPKRVPDKSRVLLLHCLSGGRSGIARQQLRAMGYANAYNLGSYSRAESIVSKQ